MGAGVDTGAYAMCPRIGRQREREAVRLGCVTEEKIELKWQAGGFPSLHRAQDQDRRSEASPALSHWWAVCPVISTRSEVGQHGPERLYPAGASRAWGDPDPLPTGRCAWTPIISSRCYR